MNILWINLFESSPDLLMYSMTDALQPGFGLKRSHIRLSVFDLVLWVDIVETCSDPCMPSPDPPPSFLASSVMPKTPASTNKAPAMVNNAGTA